MKLKNYISQVLLDNYLVYRAANNVTNIKCLNQADSELIHKIDFGSS